MRLLTGIFLLCLTTFSLTSLATTTPVGPGVSRAVQNITGEKTLRVVYDTAIHGGDVAAHGLGKYLPANSIITQAWFYTVTQFTDSGTGTVALSCEDANNIYSAADITGNSAGAIVAGVPTGTAANMVKSIAANCEVTATVAGAAQTAGKLILFIRYVVGE